MVGAILARPAIKLGGTFCKEFHLQWEGVRGHNFRRYNSQRLPTYGMRRNRVRRAQCVETNNWQHAVALQTFTNYSVCVETNNWQHAVALQTFTYYSVPDLGQQLGQERRSGPREPMRERGARGVQGSNGANTERQQDHITLTTCT